MSDRRININYHSTDEIRDMLRAEIEYVYHTRGQMIRALEELTGQEYNDDLFGFAEDENPDGDEE